ncbi:hypothetical protein N7451_007858, partial [Penicillium sp. IBT 35674x]
SHFNPQLPNQEFLQHAIRIRWTGFCAIPFSSRKPPSRLLFRQIYRHGKYCGVRSAAEHASLTSSRPEQGSNEVNSVYSETGTSSKYPYIDGVYTPVDARSEPHIPARDFTTRMIKNVSIPTLVVAEIPKVVLVSERSDHPPCNLDEKTYLATMMRGFAPFFIQSISRKSDDYLPGDAQNLCKEVANLMSVKDDDKSLNEFLEQYRKRYFGNQRVQRTIVLNSCLLNILKMPFDFSSSIRQGLMS